MKKVLFTATVDSHILQFHLPFLKLFKEKGYEVHVATNGNEEIPYCDVKHVVSFERSPFKINNLKAIKQLKKIINEEKFDIIHTHTPMGSVVTRLAAKKARKKYHTRVIYTAHGLHFFKGAPLKNWIIFYPVEKYLSKYTDTLILINQEDYNLCKRKFKKCKDIQYVPGVGIDEEKFNFTMTEEEKIELRESLGLKKDDFVMIFVARMDKNKNQGMLINCTEELVKKHNNVKLLLVGPDERDGYYQKIVSDKKIEDNVIFLGFRKDIPQLMKISDIALSSSLREGLPVNIMEAFACGLPVVANDCRGVRDLIENNKNGYIIKNVNNMINAIDKILKNKNLIKKISTNNTFKISNYYLDEILDNFSNIYHLDQKKLSIVVTVYNLENYISECLDSITSQVKENMNIEVILIDDGSTDNSALICKKYTEKYSYIKYYYQPNSGVSSARNKGIDMMTGDYLYFIDGDDILLNKSLNYIFDAISHDYDLIKVNYKSFYNVSKKINKVSNNYDYSLYDIEDFLKSDNFENMALWSNILKYDILKYNNLSLNCDLKYTEDMNFYLDYLVYCKTVLKINKEIYGYRKGRIGSATNSINKKRIIDSIFFIKKWCKFIESDYSKLNYSNLYNFMFYQYLIVIAFYEIYKKNNGKDSMIDNFISDYDYLFKYGNSKKTIICRYIKLIFGKPVLYKLLAYYIKKR